MLETRSSIFSHMWRVNCVWGGGREGGRRGVNQHVRVSIPIQTHTHPSIHIEQP